MSEFDKEAEREKLRRKLEDDREKRQHTQQMSELLLKGATMTNRHCGNCSDPIFRHNDEEFCPTCGAEADETAADRETATQEADEQGATVDADADAQAATERAADATRNETPVRENATATPRNDTTATRRDDAESTTVPDDVANANGSNRRTEHTPTHRTERRSDSPDTSTADSPDTSTEKNAGTEARSTESARSAPSAPSTTSIDDDLGTARASLARTARTFAEAAEKTTDPNRAVEHLEAARKAAAALGELNN